MQLLEQVTRQPLQKDLETAQKSCNVERTDIPLSYHVSVSSSKLTLGAHAQRGLGSRTVCVCLCVQAAHLRLTQLSDKLDILTDSVSWWLQNEFGVFRIMASFRR